MPSFQAALKYPAVGKPRDQPIAEYDHNAAAYGFQHADGGSQRKLRFQQAGPVVVLFYTIIPISSYINVFFINNNQ